MRIRIARFFMYKKNISLLKMNEGTDKFIFYLKCKFFMTDKIIIHIIIK